MKLSDACCRILFAEEAGDAAAFLRSFTYPWEVLPEIRSFILKTGSGLDPALYDHPAEDVWIHKTARVSSTASVTGPCIVGAETEIRHCAFIRGCALIGAHCVVGNSTELKNVILFDNVQVPHYNYIGDSVLGTGAHFGAGAVTSNVKSDRKNVVIHFDDCDMATGLRKAGAFLGAAAEIGCGSVLNPGTVIGAGSTVYPLSSVRGTVSAASIYKKKGEIAGKQQR